MHSLFDTPLLAGPRFLDRPAVLSRNGAPDWTWREIHHAALELAARFEDGDSICNLCNSRAGFLITGLAAWRRGCVQVLPPSGGRTDLTTLLAAQEKPLVVFDDTLPAPLSADRTRCLHYRPTHASSLQADLAWMPNWDTPCVHLYTSGSSGTPTAQVKTLGQLARGAQLLGEHLHPMCELAAPLALVCSVPSQHMFGMEASVMLPLLHGHALLEGRPLLPADVQSAFEHLKQNAWWIATPLHLRALAQSQQTLSHCRAVLTSTMPLTSTLAQQTETLLRAPVLEIYGSTETGALALRRTAHSEVWQPLPSVSFKVSEEGTHFSGPHFVSPQRVADQIEPAMQGGFKWLGRQGDLIKIAGRRGSLAQLNNVLQELPGLVDGTFYLPDEEHVTPARLVLMHTGAPLARAATEAWLRQRIDPAFLPRTFICVERLPRSATGKLPRAALDALYAEWRAQKNAAPRNNAARTFEFEVKVPAQHPALPGHFPGRALVPGVVLLDALFSALHQATGLRVRALPQVKFFAPLQPAQSAYMHCEVDAQQGKVAFRITTANAEKSLVAQGQLTLSPSLQDTERS